MTDCDRRRAVLGMRAACMMSGTHRAAAADGDLAACLADMQREGRVHGLHTLLVSRDHRVLFEHYGTGDDENWGTPLGLVTFGPTVLHDLRSVTKSIVGMLYGRFCRKVRFLGQKPKIGYQKFNDLQTAKLSKKQLCDRTP